MATLVTNRSGFPVALPFPYYGVITAGGSVILEESTGVIIRWFGGVNVTRNILTFTDLPGDSPSNRPKVLVKTVNIQDRSVTQIKLNLTTPVLPLDAATKAYVDAAVGGGSNPWITERLTWAGGLGSPAFTLAHEPLLGTNGRSLLAVTYNGVAQEEGTDYTLAADVLTWTSVVPLEAGEHIEVFYQYV